MESTDGFNSGRNLTTNWTVSGGSLGNTVTVESSVSPVDEAALRSAPKSPLILSPPPSGAPGSCVITINFSQRYEVRQVYVRSTSRVYEIYYSLKQPVDNEYLCTVRCGIAATAEAPGMCCTGESSITCLRDSDEGLDEERCRVYNSNYNDDEWVHVKSLNLGAVTDGCTSLLSKNYMNMDFYEATAEISDAEPCISLTLRLLSIQSEGCVYIDEVYVFVDPIDPNSEIQEYKADNSAGSSLLSMLVPSLLQLSRSKGSSLLSEKGSADSHGHQKQIRTGIEVTEQDKLSKECGSTSLLKVNEQGVESEVANAKAVHPIVEPAHQIYRNPYIEKRPDAPYSHIENVLEQLASRVSRMEDLFMRFEENMLKPISGIEARLQHVEQQLEALNEKTFHSGEQPCKRFLVPEYSTDNLNVNSSCGNKSECPDQGALESDKKVCSDKLSVPPEDGKSDSESSDQLFPCLTITAPEFSHGDEEEENPVLETRAVVDSPKAKRQVVSIDDALASALAGFLSSTSIQPQKYFHTLPGKTPDFSNQDKSYEENDSSVCLDATNETKLSKISSSGTVNYEDQFKEIGKESNDPVQPSEEENSNEARDMMDDAAKSVTGSGSSHQMVPIIEDGEVSTGTSFISVPDECKDLNKLLHTQIESSFHHTEEEVTNCADSDSTACEVTKRDSEEDTLNDVLALSQSACTLDFENPILDVKFASQQYGTSKSILKALLGDSPESDIDVPSGEGTLKASSSQDQTNFIEFDDANQSDVSFAVDVAYCSLQEVLVDPDSEKLQDGGISWCGEGFSGSLI